MKWKFGPKTSAELFRRFQTAGEGAEIINFLRSNDGVTWTPYTDVIGGSTGKKCAEDCDDPLNEAHICPPAPC